MIDFHCDTFLKIFDDKKELRENDYHIDLNKMKKGGALAQFFAAFIDLGEYSDPYGRCKEMINYGKNQIKMNDDMIRLAFDYSTYAKNKKDGKMSAFLAIEEGGALVGDFKKVNEFYEMGVRLITLTWNYPNEIGYPNSEFKYKDYGLTVFGKELVTYMNDKNIIVDVSHLSDKGFYDVMEFTTKPIVASHSNARDICGHSRNLTDEMLKMLGNNGGITGINYCSDFINGGNMTDIQSMIKHISHIKNIAGIETVALGSDYDGIDNELELADISYMDNLKNALNIKGFTGDEIDKIFYLNGERIIKEVL